MDKICINFIGGSLGHLVLKSVYHHWPLIFNRRTDQIDTVRHTNHQAGADLICMNSSALSDEEAKRLQSLVDRKNVFLLCHNADLIPRDKQNQFGFINILCLDYHKPEINFLFLCKSSYLTDWALIKQKNGFDPYEIMFWEFCRISKETIKIQPGVNLNFARLQDYQQIILALDFVKKVLDLPDYQCHREWYDMQYVNSIAPLNKYKEFFDLFCYFYSSWSVVDVGVNYREIIDDHRKFEKLVSFFLN